MINSKKASSDKGRKRKVGSRKYNPRHEETANHKKQVHTVISIADDVHQLNGYRSRLDGELLKRQSDVKGDRAAKVQYKDDRRRVKSEPAYGRVF